MNKAPKSVGGKFITLGLIFIAIGFAMEGLQFNFENDLFNVGLIFTVAGLAVVGFHRLKSKS